MALISPFLRLGTLTAAQLTRPCSFYCGFTDTSKPAAKALESKGVETVSADLDDKESLKKAIDGSYAVFGVTN